MLVKLAVAPAIVQQAVAIHQNSLVVSKQSFPNIARRFGPTLSLVEGRLSTKDSSSPHFHWVLFLLQPAWFEQDSNLLLHLSSGCDGQYRVDTYGEASPLALTLDTTMPGK
jgi:hypothetical protein